MGFENNTHPEIPNNQIDSQNLLRELADDIARKYQIEKSETELLIKKSTELSLDDFKKELFHYLREQKKEFSLEEKKEFLLTLKGAKEVIENISKIEIKTLKANLESNDSQININEFQNNIEAYLPNNLLQKAKNPQLPHEHILGFALGSANSLLTTTEVLFQIGKGVIQTPYHLYMIVTGKGKTDSFNNL